MKKIRNVVFLGLVMVLLTGCVKFNVNLDIKKDKSMNFDMIYAIDSKMFGENGELKEDDFAELKKERFTLTKYEDGDMKGFKISKKFANIDEISTESDTEYNLSGMGKDASENKYMFKVEKGTDKNKYYAKFKFNANDSNLNTNSTDENELGDTSDTLTSESNSLDSMDFSSLGKNLDLSFKVNLPYAALSSNATTKENDNKTLTWKLATTGAESIEFAFELPNNATSGNMMLYIGIGVLGIVAVVAIVIVLSMKKKTTKDNNSLPVNNDFEPIKKDE